MPCAPHQQECPRRAGATPHGDEASQPRRPLRNRQRGAVEQALPRVLSAGTFALAVASAAVLMLAGCATRGGQVGRAVPRPWPTRCAAPSCRRWA